MKCTNCNIELDGAKFCQFCGTAAPVNSNQVQASNKNVQVNNSKLKSSDIWEMITVTLEDIFD